MPNTVTLKELINKLSAALSEYDRLVFDEEQSREKGPPASQYQIEQLESILGRSLPPSYRAFLELHNGWSNFAGGAKLLAVEDHGSEWVKQQMDYWSSLVDDGKDPFKMGAIPVLLGVHENSFLVMDPNSVRENGEMDFVMYDYMHEEDRFEDFKSFLQKKLERLQMLIDRETKGVPDDEPND
jgi:hypothetical protein